MTQIYPVWYNGIRGAIKPTTEEEFQMRKSMNELRAMTIGALEVLQQGIGSAWDNTDMSQIEDLAEYDQDIQVALEEKYDEER